MKRTLVLMLATVLLAVAAPNVGAQSFSLDDNPSAPLFGAPGPGFGAENPFGIPVPGYPPGLAPSPSLLMLGPLGDGAILSPGPVLQHPGPNGWYVSSLSSNKGSYGRGSLQLNFSVDRTSFGLPGTDLFAEAMLNQAMGDVYSSTRLFTSPATFAGALAPVGAALPSFAGFLPGSGGPGGNKLVVNQGLGGIAPSGGAVPGLGLLTGLAVLPPGVGAPPALPMTHDNVDALDFSVFDTNGDLLLDTNTYFSVYPAEGVAVGVSSADLFLAAAGTPGAIAVPWAPAALLGLDTLGPHPIAQTPFSDCLDALVVFDNGVVGALEPGVDYALFSLAPGSASLAPMLGLINDSDVFYSDFTGLFGVYATAASLGLWGDPAGGFLPRPWPAQPGMGDGLDALDVVPEPASTALLLSSATAFGLLVWRRRRN